MNEDFMNFMFRRHSGDAFATHNGSLLDAEAIEVDHSDEDDDVEQSSWL